MERKTERLCWLVVAVLAVMCGAWIGKSGQSAEATVEGPVVQRRKSGKEGEHRNDSGKPPPKHETELRKMANHALSTPRRTERFQRLMTLLDDTTADNWNTLWKEYIRQTLEEGRVHETEWSLFMNRVGEVGGSAAMEYFSHHGQEEFTFNRREVLKGWAAVDTPGALGWLKAQPGASQPVEFWGAIMGGAAVSDSKLAMDLLSEIPETLTEQVVRSAADGLIQSEGLERTAELLEEKVATIPNSGTIPEHLKFFYRELSKRVDRMKWLADSYPDMNSRQPSLEHLKARFEGGLQPNEQDSVR